jgi:hypothetical protein
MREQVIPGAGCPGSRRSFRTTEQYQYRATLHEGIPRSRHDTKQRDEREPDSWIGVLRTEDLQLIFSLREGLRKDALPIWRLPILAALTPCGSGSIRKQNPSPKGGTAVSPARKRWVKAIKWAEYLQGRQNPVRPINWKANPSPKGGTATSPARKRWVAILPECESLQGRHMRRRKVIKLLYNSWPHTYIYRVGRLRITVSLRSSSIADSNRH